ncbi:hypothetical protein AQUCO_04300034v1 [Aquilegia coerulea]|uniref:Rx N-terminal domain-containing protein n=1 Tax=Aquilegia coerulea TaxID=218851 RepID=A0A2G5CND7_AQUCA|nr:hypothetical protein AQUCO_04300034v1 [Aquilegia coerulea]
MAEAIVITVVERLINLLIEKEANRLGGVKEQIVSLQKQLVWMRYYIRTYNYLLMRFSNIMRTIAHYWNVSD